MVEELFKTTNVDEIVEFLEGLEPSGDCCENIEARTLLQMIPEDHPRYDYLFLKFMRVNYGTDSGC